MARAKSRGCVAAAALLILAATSSGSPQAADAPPTIAGDARVDRLLGQMTLAEKIALIHGATEDAATSQAQAGYAPGIPRLGIPPLRLADGPPGILTREISGALTSTLGLAATFSRQDARDNGAVIGRNARARGIDIALEPYINIHRDQTFRRANNTYGEDPLLSGQIGARVIAGIQEHGVMAQAKHFIGYEGGNDITMDMQTLHEIYLPPFADAIAANVASIMCSYNKLNGPYACGSTLLLNDILRGEMGFKGFVTSDWGANHGAEFIHSGLDLEMPGEAVRGGGFSFFSNKTDATPPPNAGAALAAAAGGLNAGDLPEEEGPALPRGGNVREKVDGLSATLAIALNNKTVDEGIITRAARRVLLQMVRFGYLDGKQKHSITAEDIAANAPIIQRTAEHAAVLLKNEGHILPLSPAELGSVAFIGPGAGQTVAVGLSGEKALGYPERQVGIVSVLKASGANVIYAPATDMTGTPIPAAQLSHDGAPGLARTGDGAATDPVLDFTIANGRALAPGANASWKGALTAPEDGLYEIDFQILGAAGDLVIDGKTVASTGPVRARAEVLQAGQDNLFATPDGLDNIRRNLRLSTGSHSLVVTVAADKSAKPVQVRLAWSTPAKRAADRAAAIAAARSAKKVVVFAWARGRPDSFQIPGDQNQLIADIAAVNPNVVVVLNTSQPVALPWLPRVKAVMQMWYTGDEGGKAAANLLTGKVSPAGRLPFTWPMALADNVANDPAHPERSLGGVNGKTVYSEGIFVGYRWFDEQNRQPLFPFGFGLSYARFRYSGLAMIPAADGGVDVSFTLTNIDKSKADEVPQVYLGAPSSAPPNAQFAKRSLIAFDRISLAPGASKSVRLHLPLRQLQYWSVDQRRWAKAPGSRPLYVGASSRDIRLTGVVK